MKLNRALIGCWIIAIGFVALMTGCEEIGGESCEIDDDCLRTSEVCYDQVCTPLCEEDEECHDDEICQPRSGDKDDSVCVLDEGQDPNQDPNSTDPPECEDHDECGENESCIDGQCIDTGETVVYNTVLIEDRTYTEADDRCDDRTGGYDTAGAKIQWVALWDGGDLLAWGHTHDYEDGDNTEFGHFPNVVDGTPPDLDGYCPPDDPDLGHNFREDSIVAMGCGGWLTVRFDDPAGGYYHLEEGLDIEVGEFGPQCNETMQTEPEYYDVSICRAEIGEPPLFLDDFNEHCDLPLNSTPETGRSSTRISF